MIANPTIRLAVAEDADAIASMSRVLIEYGMRSRWTPRRVVACIRDPSTNVAVAADDHGIAGFAIMHYRSDEAHLALLGVDPRRRRRGIASSLIAWHEEAALTAGIGVVYLEARAGNHAARAFYRALGYREVERVAAYYSNLEDAVRFGKDLWARGGAD